MQPRPPLAPDAAARLAELALGCVHRPYPYQLQHLLREDADAQPPRALTPAFYGCFDWHSAVHGHWLLARLAALFPAEPFAARARAALAESLTASKLEGELRYLQPEERAHFERPYGLAWLLLLCAELRASEGAEPRAQAERLEELEELAARRLLEGFEGLPRPVRSGVHGQTAFSLGLALDWAKERGRAELRARFERCAVRLYAGDVAAPLHLEPSGYDFLSPSLAEADVLRRVWDPARFGPWLEAFLPALSRDGSAAFLLPEAVPDARDGLLVHLAGLDLSRAWMLEGIAGGLPAADPRREGLLACARSHERAGLAYVTDEHYEGAHWLGTFAVYGATGRGLAG